MPAPIGNQYYKLRSKDGRDLLYNSPEQFAQEAAEYIDYVVQNPIYVVNGNEKDKRMRIMSITGLCMWMGFSEQTFYEYEKREGFFEVIQNIKSIFKSQQLEGATSGFLKENIIARLQNLEDVGRVHIEQPIFGPQKDE